MSVCLCLRLGAPGVACFIETVACVHASTYSHVQFSVCATDVLKNPRYTMAFSDREYIPADSSSDDALSDGSLGNDEDDDDVSSATSARSDQGTSAGPARK